MTAIESVLIGIAIAGHVFAASVATNTLVECVMEPAPVEQTLCTFGDAAAIEGADVIVVTD